MLTPAWPAPGIWTIDDFVSHDECAALIARSEAIGCDIATVNTPQGQAVKPRVRDNDRVIVDDPAVAAML